MKSLKQFQTEAANQLELVESSITRLMSKLDTHAIGVLTAFRSCNSVAENRKRNKKLESDIKAAGYQFYRGHGRYTEGYGTPEAREGAGYEEVFIVFDKPNESGEGLKKLLLKWGNKYNQDSILWKGLDGNAWLFRTQDVDRDCNVGAKVTFPPDGGENLGGFHAGKLGMFYTKLKGKPFVFE